MPRFLYADTAGRIYDLPGHRALGLAGGDFMPVPERDLVPLPRGSEVFVIRKGVAVAQRVPAEVTNWLPSTRNLTKLERSLLSCYPEKSGPTQ